jgi:aminopeptidase YwaD
MKMAIKNKLINIILVLILLTGSITPVTGKPKNMDIRDLYDGLNAFNYLEDITDFGSRVAGGASEEAAANYIASTMESFGLEVEIQEFPMIYFEDYGSTLNVVPSPTLITDTMRYSPSGTYTEEIIYCGLGYPADFPPEVAGNIALIERGETYFYDKTQNAAAAGAVAAVIYNHGPGIFHGTLGSITDIPAVGISQEDGQFLIEQLALGPVTVELVVNTLTYPSTSQNVIGTLEGVDPEQGIVYVGAHIDTVPGSPGANDDASGLAAMLETARIFSTEGHRTKATIKFIAFGENKGANGGSYYYITTNQNEVTTQGIGMINLDMIGVGDTLEIGNYGLAGDTFEDFTENIASSWGLTYEPYVAGLNDYYDFEVVGVPTVCIRQTPDPYLNTPEDTVDKIVIDIFETNGELAASAIYGWAKNPSLRAKKLTMDPIIP